LKNQLSGAVDIPRRINERRIRAVEIAETALHRVETTGRELNAIITVCNEKALQQAQRIDEQVSFGRDIPPLAGVPVIVKDNIVCRDYPTTCGSRLLENYYSPYDATVISNLEKAGAIIVAKANMDEFAMGSSNENSAFGAAKNPVGEGLVPGGSSGGSCASVAAGIVPVALGSDTGGSIRQPAAFCGVVGLKPTYGAVSRYGLVAFASSTDQVGPIAGNVRDCALLFRAIAGYDNKDATSVDSDYADIIQSIEALKNKRYKIGVPHDFLEKDIDPEISKRFEEVIDYLKGSGHTISDISLPHARYAVAVYYLIANAEASSNLARFDGVRYGTSEGRDGGMKQMYRQTRGKGFGDEVKRRIMLGTYALSAGYYDAYYAKAQKVRNLIIRDFDRVFDEVDLIITPTTPTAAFAAGEKVDCPLQMYLSDILTIPASLTGTPAISVPCGRTADGRPIGLQVAAPAFGEADLFRAAEEIEKMRETKNA